MKQMNSKTKQKTFPKSIFCKLFWVLPIPHSSKQLSTHLKAPSPERSGISSCS